MDKEQLIQRLTFETGLNPRRCRSFLERCNFDYEKVLQLPQIKSALAYKPMALFDDPSTCFKEEPKPKEQEKPKETPKKAVEAPKKPSEPLKQPKGKVVQPTEEKPLKRKRRTKKEIEEDKKKEAEENKKHKLEMRDRIKTYNRFGFDYQVEIKSGREYFDGKEIHSDQSGFYHPYATMKEIVEWTQKYMKKPSLAVIKK